MTYVIDVQSCIACGWCRDTCPTQAVTGVFRQQVRYEIDSAWCIDCDVCAQVCPSDCISHEPATQPTPAQLEVAQARARAANARNRHASRWKSPPAWVRGHRQS